MRIALVCVDNMHDLDAARFQVIGNQGAMTTPPKRFRAHNRSLSGIVCKIDKSIRTFAKFFRLHVIGIAAKRSIAPRCIARIVFRFSSTTQFRKMFVANSDFV